MQLKRFLHLKIEFVSTCAAHFEDHCIVYNKSVVLSQNTYFMFRLKIFSVTFRSNNTFTSRLFTHIVSTEKMRKDMIDRKDMRGTKYTYYNSCF